MLQTESKHGFSCQARKPEVERQDSGKWKGKARDERKMRKR